MASFTIKSIFEAIDRMTGPVRTMRGTIGKFSKDVKTSWQDVTKGSKAVAGAIVGIGVAAGVAAKVMADFATRGDDIARNAAILGLSAEAYQELSYAAKMADVDQEAFAAASKKLNNSLGQLQSGTGALYTTLKKTNPQLALQLKNAKDTDSAFSMVSKAIASETNVQKRAALAQAAFGKTGQNLIPMMEGLADARKQARAAGAVMTDEEVKNAERLEDSLKKIKMSGMSIVNTVLAKAAAKLAPLIERASEWINANKELISQKIDKLFNAIGKAANFVAWAWKTGIIPAVLGLVAAFKAFQIAMAVATTVQWLLNVAMAANPIGLVILALAAIAVWLVLTAKNWKEWGASMSLAMGPIGPMILAIGQLAQNWTALNSAFKQGGMKAGLESLGHTIMAMLLKPLYEATKILAAITGNKTMKALSVEYSKGMDAENAAAGKYSTPVSPQAAALESRAYSESKSTVDLNVSAAQGSSVSARYRGLPPGVSLNLGNTMPRPAQ